MAPKVLGRCADEVGNADYAGVGTKLGRHDRGPQAGRELGQLPIKDSAESRQEANAAAKYNQCRIKQALQIAKAYGQIAGGIGDDDLGPTLPGFGRCKDSPGIGRVPCCPSGRRDGKTGRAGFEPGGRSAALDLAETAGKAARAGEEAAVEYGAATNA